jgi:phospholipase/carboxylesterase
MPTVLETITIEPTQAAKACVIWMHGLGSSGNDFVPAIEALALSDKDKIRFILPHAPIQPVTVNAGMMMRAWYDINSLDRELHVQDAEGIHKSYESVCHLIEQQITLGIPSDKIIIGGFSQGGAIALYTGLCYNKPLGGILALSTYLPVSDIITKQRSNANANTPILMVHGTHDDIIPLRDAEDSKNALVQMSCPVQWQTYRMGHSVCPEELFLIMNWLEEQLKG